MIFPICYAAVMDTFLITKHKLIGHRGVAGLRPENTYCSFNLVAGLGLSWFEFDVQLTKDNQWIVIHDETLDRTTNGHGLVRNKTLQQLSHLEAGVKFSPPYPGQKIPTLLGTLELAQTLQLFCNIEIKGATSDPAKHAKLMCSFLTNKIDLAKNRVLLSSFSLPCLIALRKLMPKLPIGYLIDKFSADTIAITQYYKFTSIHCDVKTMQLEFLKACQIAKIPVFLYTINDLDIAKFWIKHGIAGIFSDRPDLLRGISS